MILQNRTVTAFEGSRRIASGPLAMVALRATEVVARGETGPVLIFDDLTGEQVDADLRGLPESAAEVPAQPMPDDSAEVRGRGRPKLGVVAREVTLLPRHWQWLSSQPGGASVAIRKLVETARRTNQEADRDRQKLEAAYHFMSAMAGNLPNFEEASRALFANDRRSFTDLMADWPADVRDHAAALAFGSDSQESTWNSPGAPGNARPAFTVDAKRIAKRCRPGTMPPASAKRWATRPLALVPISIPSSHNVASPSNQSQTRSIRHAGTKSRSNSRSHHHSWPS